MKIEELTHGEVEAELKSFYDRKDTGTAEEFEAWANRAIEIMLGACCIETVLRAMGTASLCKAEAARKRGEPLECMPWVSRADNAQRLEKDWHFTSEAAERFARAARNAH